MRARHLAIIAMQRATIAVGWGTYTMVIHRPPRARYVPLDATTTTAAPPRRAWRVRVARRRCRAQPSGARLVPPAGTQRKSATQESACRAKEESTATWQVLQGASRAARAKFHRQAP